MGGVGKPIKVIEIEPVEVPVPKEAPVEAPPVETPEPVKEPAHA